jgi:uncharacterized membrane protein YdjX (TVP38/TMEM64 family)
MKTNRWKTILALLFSLLLIGLAAYFVVEDMSEIRGFIRTRGWIGLVVAVPVYAALGATIVPSEPLTLLITSIFGPFIATAVAGLGNIFGALLEYWIGGHIGNATDFVQRKERLPWGLGKLPMTSPVLLIFGRMIPGYGAKLISLLSGIYRVPVGLFLWTSALQTVLGAATTSFAGYGLAALISR